MGNGPPRGEHIGESTNAPAIGKLEQELAEATRELQLLSRPDGVDEEPSEDGVIAPLPDGTVLIEYFAIGDRLIAFLRRESLLDLRVLGSLSDLEAPLDSLNLQLQRVAQVPIQEAEAVLPRWKRGADACLYALGQELIAPLADALAGAEHLIIVPHGPLHGVPFHALAGPDGTYLADDVAISYVPSADVYERCIRDNRAPGQRLFLVGVDGDDLPWVRQELKEIAEIWPDAETRLGKRATRAALRRQAGVRHPARGNARGGALGQPELLVDPPGGLVADRQRPGRPGARRTAGHAGGLRDGRGHGGAGRRGAGPDARPAGGRLPGRRGEPLAGERPHDGAPDAALLRGAAGRARPGGGDPVWRCRTCARRSTTRTSGRRSW